LHLQLEPADGLPGVLQDCTGLTALHIRSWQECYIQKGPLGRRHAKITNNAAAFEALAALSGLRSLQLQENNGRRSLAPIPHLQGLQNLTQLAVVDSIGTGFTEEVGKLSELTALSNLVVLKLHNLPLGGVPGGIPSQLSSQLNLDGQG
jgi:hypothetical protein